MAKKEWDLLKIQKINTKQNLSSNHYWCIRYYNSVKTYADTLKTDKGKSNQYQKFYDTLMNYRNVMNEENIKYIEYKYKQSINR